MNNCSRAYVAVTVGTQYLALQPREIVHPDAILLAAYRNKNVLSLEYFHLLKPSSADQLVDLALSTSVQQHQTIFRTDEKIHTCDGQRTNLHLDRPPVTRWSKDNHKRTTDENSPHSAAQRISLLNRFLYFLISGVSEARSWLVGVTLTLTCDSRLAGPAPNPKVRKDRCFCWSASGGGDLTACRYWNKVRSCQQTVRAVEEILWHSRDLLLLLILDIR